MANALVTLCWQKPVLAGTKFHMFDYQNLNDYNKSLQPKNVEGSHTLYLRDSNFKDKMTTLKVLHIFSPQKSLSGSRLGASLRNLLVNLKGFEHSLKSHTFFWISMHFLKLLVFIQFLKGYLPS